jgi:hypothetical protein
MVLVQLSSQRGDPDYSANRALAARCLDTPGLIEQVVTGLGQPEPAIIADCADVLAEVADSRPDLVAPHGGTLVPLLDHPKKRIRWETMRVLALIAGQRPDLVGPLLPRLMATIAADTSVIARDKATDAVASYAGSSPAAAHEAMPYLIEILSLANGRFASRALHGLRLAVIAAPDLAGRLSPIADQYLDHHRGVARTAAKRLVRQIETAG